MNKRQSTGWVTLSIIIIIIIVVVIIIIIIIQQEQDKQDKIQKQSYNTIMKCQSTKQPTTHMSLDLSPWMSCRCHKWLGCRPETLDSCLGWSDWMYGMCCEGRSG